MISQLTHTSLPYTLLTYTSPICTYLSRDSLTPHTSPSYNHKSKAKEQVKARGRIYNVQYTLSADPPFPYAAATTTALYTLVPLPPSLDRFCKLNIYFQTPAFHVALNLTLRAIMATIRLVPPFGSCRHQISACACLRLHLFFLLSKTGYGVFLGFCLFRISLLPGHIASNPPLLQPQPSPAPLRS